MRENILDKWGMSSRMSYGYEKVEIADNFQTS